MQRLRGRTGREVSRDDGSGAREFVERAMRGAIQGEELLSVLRARIAWRETGDKVAKGFDHSPGDSARTRDAKDVLKSIRYGSGVGSSVDEWRNSITMLASHAEGLGVPKREAHRIVRGFDNVLANDYERVRREIWAWAKSGRGHPPLYLGTCISEAFGKAASALWAMTKRVAKTRAGKTTS